MLPLLEVSASTAAWMLSYRYMGRCWNDELDYDIRCRILTVIHAIVVIACGAWTVCFERNGVVFPNQENTSLGTLICVIALGYFVFDFWWLAVYSRKDVIMLCHHILCLIIFTVTLATETCASEICVILMIAEVSNPFLQFRTFFRKSRFKNTWFSTINDLLFIQIFFLCRMILMPFMLWIYFGHPSADNFVFLVGIALYIIGWIWWLMMMKYLHYKFFKSKAS